MMVTGLGMEANSDLALLNLPLKPSGDRNERGWDD